MLLGSDFTRNERVQLTYLCFANDLMLFSHESSVSITMLKDIIHNFMQQFGLSLNQQKSEMFLAGVSEDNIRLSYCRYWA